MLSSEFDQIFGRQNKLGLLNRRVLDLKEGYRHNLAFLGDRFIGKSLLLQKFVQDLDDKQIVPVYLDLENCDLSGMFNRIIGSLLYRFVKLKGLPVQNDLSVLMETVQSVLPQTVKAAKKVSSAISHGKNQDAFQEILALPQIFTRESDLFCVFIFDEFHLLEDIVPGKVFQDLGNQIMTQKRCLYIVASSLPVLAHNILNEKLSLLFGNFEIIEVGPFTPKVSHAYIQTLIKESAIKEPLSRFMIDFTGGHPFYLNIICRELLVLQSLHQQTGIYIPLLIQAAENILFQRGGILNRHFELIMEQISAGKNNRIIPQLMTVLAEGKQKVREIVKALKMKPNLLTPKLNRLVDLGVIDKNGQYYYPHDRLFKFWIRHVYQARQTTMDWDTALQQRTFRQALEQSYEAFHLSADKDLASRIVELFHCFENESLQINGRRYKLPTFHDVTAKKIRQAAGTMFDVIKASTDEGEWIIVPRGDSVQESDIQNIVQESRKMSQKPQRCILISLNDLDENARVKALQERMWVWNEGELNALFNIFDKPYIVTVS